MKNKKYLTIILLLILVTALVFVYFCKKESNTLPIESEDIVVEETSEPIEEIEAVEDATESTDEKIVEETEVNTEQSTQDTKPEGNIAGEDSPTDEEIEQELEQEKKEEEASGTSQSDNTNGGKGYNFKGKHYNTLEEYLDAVREASAANGVVSPEESQQFFDEMFGND